MDNGSPSVSVVLVHGAYADGSSWSDVIELLLQAGIPVTAVQNPLTSLAEDVAATRRAVELAGGPVVLAGHSWAGTVITEAGAHDTVRALVYVAARAPDVGEDYTALAGRYPAPPASAGLVFTDGFGRLTHSAFVEHFANGVEKERAEVLYAVQGPIAQTLFASRTTAAAWRQKPCWYAVSQQDHTTSPDLERFLADRMRARTIELPSGHLSIVTHPRDIADLILQAVEAVQSVGEAGRVHGALD
ncbi:alpha/beta fold hydrolase [Leifsonia sp. 2TAF2]|uniref:alpha/beta fold hydrolase n=1 Tax=Leifsonia sp. 2TAF2 TaxID=3233009 RepID=UPI003F99AECF